MTAPAGGPKLAVDGLRKVFDDRRSGEVVALDGVDFEIAEKEFVTVIGTSGCGKSTLLSIIAGLEEETDGVVLVDGDYVVGPGRDRGVVFQSYTLFPWLTAQQNVEFALRGSGRERTEIAREHLSLVGLERFGDAYPSQLSGGMRQRVAIARALSYKPEVLLMDEPFGALDAQTRQLMQELLIRVWEEHRLTVMFVTHDIDEAVFLSDRVLVMTARPGRIKEELRVEIERPRTFEIFSSPEFFEYKSQLLDVGARGEPALGRGDGSDRVSDEARVAAAIEERARRAGRARERADRLRHHHPRRAGRAGPRGGGAAGAPRGAAARRGSGGRAVRARARSARPLDPPGSRGARLRRAPAARRAPRRRAAAGAACCSTATSTSSPPSRASAGRATRSRPRSATGGSTAAAPAT